jgi:hypothetical protein
MSTLDNPVEAIDAAMADAIAAQEAGDFATAERRARTAWMLVASLPDSELSEERMKWKPEAIQAIVQELAKRAAVTGTPGVGNHGCLIRPIEIEYQRG